VFPSPLRMGYVCFSGVAPSGAWKGWVVLSGIGVSFYQGFYRLVAESRRVALSHAMASLLPSPSSTYAIP